MINKIFIIQIMVSTKINYHTVNRHKINYNPTNTLVYKYSNANPKC